MCAMTAMSLDQLSGGRFIAGLGASGPQVVEGWHGVPYGKPVTRTKEYIQIMRKIFERDGPVELDGNMYQLPNKTGEPRALARHSNRFWPPRKTFLSTPLRSPQQGSAARAKSPMASFRYGWTLINTVS